MYNYIIQRFGQDYSAYILAIGTISAKGTIDEIGRALSLRWEMENEGDKSNNPYSISAVKAVKDLFEQNEEMARKKHPDIFYYFDGLVNTAISQSMHPAGIVVSPVSLPDNYGYLIKEEKKILQIDMEEIHEISLVKYDILGLKNIQVIRECCKLAGIPYPKSHLINWNDPEVWEDMIRSPVGIFQFESEYAFNSLKKFRPKSIFDMSLVTAAIRPSGSSYRDGLFQKQINKNPSEVIDEMLAANYGYLVYQEDVIKFLQEICGLTGSEADNIRRAIGRKDEERLKTALPAILEGYCLKSNKPREEAEEEAKIFLKIIEDSSSYMFGYNHSLGYCMIGYMCAYLRYHYPHEFITAFLNCAMNEDDIANGCEVCSKYKIKMIPPRFGLSGDNYVFDKNENVIAMGVASIKFLNRKNALQLRELSKQSRFDNFIDLLSSISVNTGLDTRQRDILIRIGYFSEYGSIVELIKITEAFDYFKQGKAKSIRKDKITNYSCYIRLYSTDKNKDGRELKTYTITDCMELLRHIERDILSSGLEDVSYGQKIKWQQEFMSSIQPSGLEKDRWNVFVEKIYPARRKKDGKLFGYNVDLISLGSGKKTRATIFTKAFKNGTAEGAILKTRKDWWSRNGGYFNLDKYEILELPV